MTENALSSSTIGKLDGGITGRIIDEAINEALHDCDNRPNLSKGRKIAIEIEIKPRAHDSGASAKGIDITSKCKVTLPPYQSDGDYLPLNSKRGARGEEKFSAFIPSQSDQPEMLEPKHFGDERGQEKLQQQNQ